MREDEKWKIPGKKVIIVAGDFNFNIHAVANHFNSIQSGSGEVSNKQKIMSWVWDELKHDHSKNVALWSPSNENADAFFLKLGLFLVGLFRGFDEA